jgi:hypothetical protein
MKEEFGGIDQTCDDSEGPVYGCGDAQRLTVYHQYTVM